MKTKDQIKTQIQLLKSESGSHSPSIATLLKEIPQLKIEIDACFLSNPYATDLFLEYMDTELIKKNKLKSILEYYPPQNYDIRKHISKAIKVTPEKIFVGNGAIEVIQAVLHRFVNDNICIILPTFSSYYEFISHDTKVYYYNLEKEDKFKLDIEKYIEFIKSNKIKNAVIINPNNPNGGYLSMDEMAYLIKALKDLDNLIIDESFIHFAYESADMFQISSEALVEKYPNLTIIKSMSKDFGIAGIRAGYGIMNEKKVAQLLNNGYLWNVSGIADYFFKVYGNEVFQKEYEIVRKKYIMNTMMFLTELDKIPNIISYPSKANFALIEIINGKSSFDVTMELLVDSNIYVRDCQDKIGLNGNFIRVASRTFEENLKIIDAFKKV